MNRQRVHNLDDIVTSARVEAYRQDGAILLPGLVSAEWIEVIRHGIERNLENHGHNSAIRVSDAAGHIFFEDAAAWRRIDEYRQFLFDSTMPVVAALLTGRQELRVFFDNIFVKDPVIDAPTPWHQDLPYTPMEGELCSLWVALDAVSAEHSLELIAGSHRWGRAYRPVSFTPEAVDRPGFNTLEPQPDMNTLRDNQTVLNWAVEPGDVIAFNGMTLHASSANGGTARRHTFIARYAVDGAVYTPRGAGEYPQFPDCGLEAGQPLGGVQFPLADVRHGHASP